MKKHLLFFAGLMFAGLMGFAQANLVIFSEDGDAFYAYINGVRQNDQPETNVKITGLSGSTSLRIEFADKALPQLKQAMALEPGFEHTARIKRDMKKQLKLRYFGQTPINNSQTQGLSTVPYHTAENPYNTAGSTPTYDNSNTISNNNNTSVTGSTITTATYSSPGSGAVNISMPGVNVNMNPAGATMNTTTSTTVTNSSYSSSQNGYDNSNYANNNSNYNNNNNNNNNPHNGHHPNNSNQQPVTTAAGCRGAMADASFAKLKQTVESKPFSDTKMSTAKVATKNGCLSTSQVKEICKLFSMDDDKLAYAKYAYEFCVDKANYYQVSEVFSFSTTTDEFNKFLEQ